MNYKEIEVWSAGNKSATSAKLDMFTGGIALAMLFTLHVAAFLVDPLKINGTAGRVAEHILSGMFFVITLGWITLLVFFLFIDAAYNIKNNKRITLSLYSIQEFTKLGKLPEDKFVLFSDEYGIVLADKKVKKESKYFGSGLKRFSDFEYRCKKYAVKKEF